jgi:hypothetical protein
MTQNKIKKIVLMNNTDMENKKEKKKMKNEILG